MKIYENDCAKVIITETVYAKKRTLRITGIGGQDREIDLVRLDMNSRSGWKLSTIYCRLVLEPTKAQYYYDNVKSSYLKTFGVRE